jgi:hypothetical protein
MLNDELRQHLLGGGAVMTPGIAALGSEAVNRLIGPSPPLMIFAPPTTLTASMTLGRSISMARSSCSRLIIMTRT